MMTATTYFLETFGCQMNVLDSQLVEGTLRGLGLRRVEAAREADVVLFNTCSVRQHAEDKVLSRLGQLKGLKRRRPEVLIGVIGCMAQRQKEALFEQVPHLDVLCGPAELHRLPALLTEAATERRRVAALDGSQSRRTAVADRAQEADPLEAFDLSRRVGAGASLLQSYIRVQRGCDKFCAYCVVPFTRGPERSRPADHVVAEAEGLVDDGCREVTLLGQTVNSYVHQDGGRPVKFARLLERVAAVPGIDRVRFVTSFPADFDEDVFRVMRDYPRVCPYLHIPAQSGSDRILKAMKRGYTTAQYLRLMDTARRHVPDIALAGDFIVGFCGETREDFAATMALARQVEYKSLFVFKYSPRPGTAADRAQADDVPHDVKAARNNELLAVQAEISLRQKQRLIGEKVEVLVEGYSKAARRAREGETAAEPRPGGSLSLPVLAAQDAAPNAPDPFVECEQDRGSEAIRPGTPEYATLTPSGLAATRRQLVGRTRHDLITVFYGDPRLIGAIARVRIEAVSPLTLFGSLDGVVSAAREE